jgi:hypothetical protein
MSRVNVYESEFCNKIVARVKYNEKLDYWNGRNWGNGGLGKREYRYGRDAPCMRYCY